MRKIMKKEIHYTVSPHFHVQWSWSLALSGVSVFICFYMGQAFRYLWLLSLLFLLLGLYESVILHPVDI